MTHIGKKVSFGLICGFQESYSVPHCCWSEMARNEHVIDLKTNNGRSIRWIRDEYFHTLTLNRQPSRPELWDGHTAERIVEKLVEKENGKTI
ncbi:MAG TPA: hypothetical protein PLM07_08545 [Candidatus Rifleibacterium sp.]|nr:hypothetical protein [Candidatus Rifleibacterium sp.]